MLRIGTSIIQKMQSLTFVAQFNMATRVRKIPNLHQRMKRYGKYPQKYKLVTYMRPPNLRDPTLQFPIRIPLRYRHIYKPTKPLFIDDTKQIKWQRLSPNQILLAFEKIQYLKHQEIMTGLQYLSKIQGQQNHDWNQHPWVNSAFSYVNKNFFRIKVTQLMKHYHLMKTLGCKNQQFWKKMYAQIQQNMYDLFPSDFQYLFLKYYKNADQYFGPQMKQKFLKLMEGRLRQFRNSTILKIFQIYLEENRLDGYWLENVFIPLFKNHVRKYKIQQIGQIFRFMMIVGHQKNQRLYENLYQRLLTYQYQTVEQVELLEDVILEVKQIFTSHRVEPYIEFLSKQKQRLRNVKEEKKLQLYQIVKQDLIFFTEKRKIKLQQIAA